MPFWNKKVVEAPLEEKAFVSSQFWGIASPSISGTVYGSALTSAMQWLQTQIREPDLVFQKRVNDEWVNQGALPPQLLRNPDNINLSIKDKTAGVASDLLLYGNACFLKLRNGRRQVVGIQYIPWLQCNIKMTSDNLGIDSYLLNNKAYSINDIIHIRRGIDPRNSLKGLGVYDALLQHNLADYAASIYSNALISSPAPSSVIVAKKPISQDAADRLAGLLKERTSNSAAGSATVISGDFDFQKLSLTPDELHIEGLINYTESRICALTGIHAQVLGLSSGSNPTFSNFKEALKAVTNNTLVPMWMIIADGITNGLYELFDDNSRVMFDYENIQSLQSDLNEESDRVGKLYQAGIIDRAEAKGILNMDVSAEDKGVFRQ